MTASHNANLYDVLAERGLVSQCTDDKIRDRLARPVAAYCGFDPTADSLHVGSLVPIMGLAHLQRCGHKPVVLVGGATGLVGDPSGKTEARQMLSAEDINQNAQAIAKQIGRVVDFNDSDTGAILVNNLDWFGEMKWLDMLRDVGSRMSVNRMMSMESVKGRMSGDGEGISFLEFSYMLLQGYDFAHLYDAHRCTLQIGGQDQWGNIVIGIDLGRRLHDADLAGLTFPLVTKSDGGKFGKSEQGNVWLDANRTSVFDFYQFWRNVDDKDVGRFLGYFTFLPMNEVAELASAEGKAINESKIRLAYEVTKLVHGEAEANQARDSAGKAFSDQRDLTGDAIPHADFYESEVDGQLLIALMSRAGRLAASNGEARRFIKGGGVRLNGEKVQDVTYALTLADVKDDAIVIQVGKKKFFRYDVKRGL
ncbi:MAG: tyrosine--tRNA ligase [Phycisphaeraceae bacterium]